MALKILLKPNERMIIGGAVVRNAGRSSAHLIIENRVPVLREKDIIGEAQADTVCRRVYFTIQLLYIDKDNPQPHLAAYREQVEPLKQAVPQLVPTIDKIDAELGAGRYYQALKLARKLIAYEEEARHHANASI